MKYILFLTLFISSISFSQEMETIKVKESNKASTLKVKPNEPKTENIDSILNEVIASDDTLKAVIQDTTIKVEQVKKEFITLVAVGDIMMGTNFPNAGYLPPKEEKLLAPVQGILQSADVTFGNLEGTVLNEGGNVKKCSDPSKCYAFRQPEYLIDELKEAGFDLLSVANNHVGDFGTPGRENTSRVLEAKGFAFAGMESCPWDTITLDGITYGFAAFSPNKGTIKITDYDRATEIVSMLDSISDIVVVSFHGGAEGSSKTHVTRKTETFYGENRGNVYKFSRVVIDAGADVVLGHGPHVTRAMDVYKNRFITYSMGNFCTYHRFNLRGVNGVAPIFKLRLKPNGELMDGDIISIKQLGEGGPLPDANNGALEQVKTLTSSDIPELDIEFSEDGHFQIK